MKRIVALSIGHGPVKDKGAESKDGKVTELDWNRDLVKMIASKMTDSRIHTHIINRRVERLAPAREINAAEADIAAEFHLNAYDGTATGSEVIHYPGSEKGKELAAAILAAAVKVLGLKDRGIKEPVNGRGMQLLKDTDMPCVIVESFFIDNPEDLKRGESLKEALAQAYADALTRFAISLPEK